MTTPTLIKAGLAALLSIAIFFDAVRSLRAAFTYTSIGVNVPSFVTAVVELFAGGALAFMAATLYKAGFLPDDTMLAAWLVIIVLALGSIVTLRRRLHARTPDFLKQRINPVLALTGAVIATAALAAVAYTTAS